MRVHCCHMNTGKAELAKGTVLVLVLPSTLAPSALGSFMGAAAVWALQKCWSSHLCSCRCWKTKIEELPARCRLFASGMTIEDGFWSRFLTASITNTLTNTQQREWDYTKFIRWDFVVTLKREKCVFAERSGKPHNRTPGTCLKQAE